MKIFQTALVALMTFCLTTAAQAQDAAGTGKIYLVRNTGYNGVALAFHCFIDSSRVCDLRNKRYSVHEVPAGEHRVNVKIYSKELKSPKHTTIITVEPGKSYYVRILPEKTYSFEAYLKTLAVSESLIKPVMAKCEEETNCLK